MAQERIPERGWDSFWQIRVLRRRWWEGMTHGELQEYLPFALDTLPSWGMKDYLHQVGVLYFTRPAVLQGVLAHQRVPEDLYWVVVYLSLHDGFVWDRDDTLRVLQDAPRRLTRAAGVLMEKNRFLRLEALLSLLDILSETEDTALEIALTLYGDQDALGERSAPEDHRKVLLLCLEQAQLLATPAPQA